MSALMNEIMEHNRSFVAAREYEQYNTSKYPDKKLAVVACMDTRLVELLPAAMGLKNGDAKLIKNAGANITHPFGSVMRSLLVAIYQLKVEEIAVVGHYDCGMQGLEAEGIIEAMRKRGIKKKDIDLLNYCGFDLSSWLSGFENAEKTVLHSVHLIRSHPLVPDDLPVHGFLMDPATGRLEQLES